jgi:hypothetical protein
MREWKKSIFQCTTPNHNYSTKLVNGRCIMFCDAWTDRHPDHRMEKVKTIYPPIFYESVQNFFCKATGGSYRLLVKVLYNHLFSLGFYFAFLSYCVLLVSSWWPHLCTIRPNFTSILKDFLHFYLTGMFWDLQTWTLDLYIDVFWYGVNKCGCSPFVRIALPSSLMLWLKVKVVPSRWNWHITPDLCLATSCLHNLIFTTV